MDELHTWERKQSFEHDSGISIGCGEQPGKPYPSQSVRHMNVHKWHQKGVKQADQNQGSCKNSIRPEQQPTDKKDRKAIDREYVKPTDEDVKNKPEEDQYPCTTAQQTFRGPIRGSLAELIFDDHDQPVTK